MGEEHTSRCYLEWAADKNLMAQDQWNKQLKPIYDKSSWDMHRIVPLHSKIGSDHFLHPPLYAFEKLTEKKHATDTLLTYIHTKVVSRDNTTKKNKCFLNI